MKTVLECILWSNINFGKLCCPKVFLALTNANLKCVEQIISFKTTKKTSWILGKSVCIQNTELLLFYCNGCVQVHHSFVMSKALIIVTGTEVKVALLVWPIATITSIIWKSEGFISLSTMGLYEGKNLLVRLGYLIYLMYVQSLLCF